MSKKYYSKKELRTMKKMARQEGELKQLKRNRSSNDNYEIIYKGLSGAGQVLKNIVTSEIFIKSIGTGIVLTFLFL